MEETRESLLDEWSAGPYQRAVDLPNPVNGALATATYGNGVLVVALPIAETTTAAHFQLEQRRRWDALDTDIPFLVIESPIREYVGALVRYLDLVQRHEHPDCFVTVVVPQALPTSWLEPLLCDYSVAHLRQTLLVRPRTAVTNVPYHVRVDVRAMYRGHRVHALRRAAVRGQPIRV